MKRKPKQKLIQLKSNQTKKIRKRYWIKQNKKCAILKRRIKFEDTALDHKHKLKNQKAGPKGRGLCRGVLHKQANSLEGVIVKKYKRYGLNKFIPLHEFLINMAEYLLNPTIPQKFIHYKEKEKVKHKTFGKRDYNKMCKFYHQVHPRSKGIPPFPKKGIKIIKSGKQKGKEVWKTRLTKKWEILLKEVNKY